MNISGATSAIKAFKEATQGDTHDASTILHRANVCGDNCPKRKPVSGVVSRVSQKLGIITNKNKVPDEIRKYKCGVCNCALILLIPSKTPHKDTAEQAKERPKKCWMFETPPPH